MKTDVVKGVNNKDNWGFGQERATFPSMVGCLEMFGNIPLWGYWRSCPDHFKDRFVERTPMANKATTRPIWYGLA
jgi:hypothetical protein